MLVVAAFWIFASAALLSLFFSGNREARVIGVACVAAIVATRAAHVWGGGILPAQPLVLAVDAALFAYAVTLSLRSTAFWPLWFAGFQAIAVAAGVAGLVFSAAGVLDIYVNYGGFWALPALGAAVAGVMLDRRAAARRKFSLGSHL